MAAKQSSRVERWIPGVRVARTYERTWLRSDLVAGAVLAAILVPQGMAYAELAGLPAVVGLYTTIACLVGYAVFGPSRVLVLGPDSSISPLILAALVPLLAGDDPATAIVLAGMLAVLVGLIQVLLGLGRLGFVADLLSSEVQVGYMNGLAITIVVSQLPKLFGFSTDADGFAESCGRSPGRRPDRRDHPRARRRGARGPAGAAAHHPPGAGDPRRDRRRNGRVGRARARRGGRRDRRALPQGVPEPAFPWTSIDDLGPLLIAAVGITLVSLTDTVATATSFAARRGDEVDPDREMVGVGAANLAAGLFQGFAVSTSSSRTAVAEQSGARTQVTNLVGAGLVALLLLFLNSLLTDLPQTALAAVVIVAALSLADIAVLRRYFRVRKSALALSLAATAGVVVFGVLEGIVIAVVMAILLFFRRSWRPHGAVLGRVEGMDGWHSVRVFPHARELPGIVVYRWEAPLFFANAGTFRQQVRRLMRDRHPSWIVLQCEAITDVNVTAAKMLEDLDLELNAAGCHLAFVEMRSRLQDLTFRYGLFETLDRDHFYPTLERALEEITSEQNG